MAAEELSLSPSSSSSDVQDEERAESEQREGGQPPTAGADGGPPVDVHRDVSLYHLHCRIPLPPSLLHPVLFLRAFLRFSSVQQRCGELCWGRGRRERVRWRRCQRSGVGGGCVFRLNIGGRCRCRRKDLLFILSRRKRGLRRSRRKNRLLLRFLIFTFLHRVSN